MNNDTNSSMLSGQKILCNKLNDIEIKKFKDIINKIIQLKIFSDNKINNKLKIISLLIIFINCASFFYSSTFYNI